MGNKAKILKLEIHYFNAQSDPSATNLITAYVHRSGGRFIPQSSVEVIRIDLQALIDTAPYTASQDDLTALRIMAQHLSNGVNKYICKDFRVIN